MMYLHLGLFICYLIAVTITDFKTLKIPNKLNLVGLGIGILGILFNPLISLKQSILGMLFGFFIMLFITIVTKGGFGAGDIKLSGVIGINMGFHYTFYILLFAGWMQTIYQSLAKKKIAPLGPTISLCSFVAIIFLILS